MTNPEFTNDPLPQGIFKLRFLVTETEKKYNTSWCSSPKCQTYIEKSKPVLQYSINSGEWVNVETVIEKVKE